jgi:methyl-accepting chemotaxis protein
LGVLKKGRRKRYFLSGSIQPRLLLGFAVLLLILIVIAGGLFYLLANRELSAEYYKAHSTLRYVMQNLLPWLLLVNLAGILVALFLAVFYTHRIAGPAYRIQQDLRKISQGILTTRVRTRRKDQLKGLESEVNRVAQEFEQGILQVKQSLLKLEGSLADLEKATSTGEASTDRLQQMVRQIRSCHEEMSRRLSFFRTG